MRNKTGVSEQDRYGFHTYRRGDVVQYMSGEPGESIRTAVVYGIIVKREDAGKSQQGRKYLLLYEVASQTFFIQFWAAWRRVSSTADTDWNVDSANGALTCSDEVLERMQED